VFDPVNNVERLHRDAHPQVVRPVEPVGEPLHPMRAFRQRLIRVLWRLADYGEDVAHERKRNPRMEQVAHRVDEHDSRTAPPVRLSEGGRVSRDPEARP
jgi:hypothetical protein